MKVRQRDCPNGTHSRLDVPVFALRCLLARLLDQRLDLVLQHLERLVRHGVVLPGRQGPVECADGDGSAGGKDASVSMAHFASLGRVLGATHARVYCASARCTALQCSARRLAAPGLRRAIADVDGVLAQEEDEPVAALACARARLQRQRVLVREVAAAAVCAACGRVRGSMAAPLAAGSIFALSDGDACYNRRLPNARAAISRHEMMDLSQLSAER